MGENYQGSGLVEAGQTRSESEEGRLGRLLREGQQQIDEARAIREATHTGRPLGSAEYVGGLEQRWERKLTPGKAGRPRKAHAVGAG